MSDRGYSRMRMVSPAHFTARTLLLLVSLALFFSSAQSETIEDRFSWPPVFKRSFGNPDVIVAETPRSAEGKSVSIIYPLSRVIVRVEHGTSSSEIDATLADFFLGHIWSRYLSGAALSEKELKLRCEELIPLEKDQFFRIGRAGLRGKPSGNKLHDAWWKVRMGLPLTESKDEFLGVTSLMWDDPRKKSFGHYALALRARGGDVARDVLFDFRAPWHLDRRPRITEAPNVNNQLKLRALGENLYDWLYTQTEYRNSHVKMSFVRVHEEQAALLRAWESQVHQAGNFRVFKKNCASLGVQIANRLLPLDQRISGDKSFADFPLRSCRATVRRFGGAICEVEIRNVTVQRGRKPTSKSQLRRAQPSRTGSRPYQKLLKVPEIN